MCVSRVSAVMATSIRSHMGMPGSGTLLAMQQSLLMRLEVTNL